MAKAKEKLKYHSELSLEFNKLTQNRKKRMERKRKKKLRNKVKNLLNLNGVKRTLIFSMLAYKCPYFTRSHLYI